MRKIEILSTILIIILISIGFFIYNSNSNYVIIRFNELGPLAKNMSVYYKGFKIGKITKILPSKDFKHTLVKVNLSLKDINLPQNITTIVERFPNGELYLQFIYPESPSLIKLKRGDIIEGITTSSIEQFMLGQSISSMSDLVSIHVIKALDAMDSANKEMELFFKVTSKLIEKNSKEFDASINNTNKMTKSLAQMAENLNQTTQKLNNAIDEKTLKDTTVNVKNTTENISKATKDLDQTFKKLDDTMSEINATAQNLNSITSGVNETLGKRFGGMRLMFGTPIDSKKCVKNACK